MNPLARILRAGAKLRFRLLGLATIKDIPTPRFREIVDSMKGDGWRKTGEYEGFDAWIDYGQIKMEKGGVRLKFEWDNWTEGSIEGPPGTVEEMGRRYGLAVTHKWRWSEYVDADQTT